METKIDYFNEKEKLDNFSSDFMKFETGQYKLVCLSEIETYEFRDKNKPDSPAETRYKVLVEHNGEQKQWTFGFGRTPASTYGQLVNIACENKGVLTGVPVLVIVKSDGKKNDYAILDLNKQGTLTNPKTENKVETQKVS